MIGATVEDVGPLLSSVSVMLAAYGVFYATQRERIDSMIDRTDVPDGLSDVEELEAEAKRCRNVAAVLALAALAIWLLLLNEIVERLVDAAESHSLGDYSAPDAVFVVAATAWLLLAVYVGTRWKSLRKRRQDLSKAVKRKRSAVTPAA